MLFERDYYKKIELFLKDKEIIVIHGSRQVGKTSLMRFIIEKNKFIKDNHLFIDLEEPEFLDICNSGVETLMDYLRINGYLKTTFLYLFIDEIQYLENPSSFLKLLHDKYRDKLKLIVSGSSSFAIKSKFKVSLVGRTINFELFPLSFKEYLRFNKITIDLSNPIKIEIVISELKKHFSNFIKFGGYPEIVLEENIEKKKIKLNQIILTYIKADIRDIGRIRHIEKFNKLLEILSSQIGNLVNISELSNTIGIARQTVEEYLFVLENTYLIKLLRPYYSNIRTEVSKMPKIFFEDTGVANLFRYGDLNVEIDGQIFENAIFNELRKEYGSENLHFLRTKKRHEIDFILKKGKKITPIETKFNFTNKRLTSLLYFKDKGYFDNAFLCRLNDTGKNKYNWLTLLYPWELTNSNLF